MHVILIPGLWLDGSSWEQVTPTLEAAGHRTHPMTLPGLESRDADRSSVTLGDHVAAVVDEIDGCDRSQGVVLVGHSAAGGIVFAAVDARPDRVARAIYIGGFPSASGEPIASGFATEGGDLPMPDPSEFDEADVKDMDAAALTAFQARAIPSPAHLTEDLQQLVDDRRYDVPATAICPEYTADQLQQWIKDGEPPVMEFAKIRDLSYVDLPTGHWPQFTRPQDLAKAILATID